MKPLLFLGGILTCAIVASQAQHTADDLAFQNAISLYEDGRENDALLAFYEFMNLYPQSPLRGRTHYNIGYIQFERHNYQAAATAFKQILDEDYNERDSNSLMEPYMLYKHQSCRM